MLALHFSYILVVVPNNYVRRKSEHKSIVYTSKCHSHFDLMIKGQTIIINMLTFFPQVSKAGPSRRQIKCQHMIHRHTQPLFPLGARGINTLKSTVKLKNKKKKKVKQNDHLIIHKSLAEYKRIEKPLTEGNRQQGHYKLEHYMTK